MRDRPRNTDGLGGWFDAGEALGVYTDAEADWLAWLPECGEARYIRPGSVVAADEAVIPMPEYHHGAHAAIAVRATKGRAA